MRVAESGVHINCSLPGGRSLAMPWRIVTNMSQFSGMSRVSMSVITFLPLLALLRARPVEQNQAGEVHPAGLQAIREHNPDETGNRSIHSGIYSFAPGQEGFKS